MECSWYSNSAENSFPVWLTVDDMTVYYVGGRCLGVGGKPVCHEKAICHDELEGGVLCECLDGYRGDGVSSCTGMSHKPLRKPHLKVYEIEHHVVVNNWTHMHSI